MTERVFVTSLADADLVAIWLYVFEHAESDHRADAQLDRLRDCFEALAGYPNMGTARPQWGPDVHAAAKDDYLVVYRPRAGGVDILRVSGGDQDLLAIE